PLRGLLTGTGLTALMQSSTAITVITIGLVNTQIISFSQTLGIILGTNIGTCITTELVGLNITKLSLPLFISGASMWLLGLIAVQINTKKPSIITQVILFLRYIGLALGGFACLLFGMEMMQSIVPALQSKG